MVLDARILFLSHINAECDKAGRVHERSVWSGVKVTCAAIIELRRAERFRNRLKTMISDRRYELRCPFATASTFADKLEAPKPPDNNQPTSNTFPPKSPTTSSTTRTTTATTATTTTTTKKYNNKP
uniref:Uncharacterized protein n=1 Tax=Glossina austeni TaxID=7395 RepID=A0A1A9VE96_GLOAU